MNKMKEFTLEDLSEYNGQDGKPAYVVHNGKVYDVSESKLWKAGLHMRRHKAGTDLTADIQAAPHGNEVLDNYSQVGTLKKETTPNVNMPKAVQWLLETNPFFRRHPHPMTVHFPIVFFLANPFFNILFLLTGGRSFETTAVHCLAGGILFSLVAIATGLLTWWYNYMAKIMKPIAIKLPLSIILFVLALILFIWRLMDPLVVINPEGPNLIYLLMVLSLVPMISILGWFGATMTFPIEKD
jgi:predicted heme/steroid binding protein/uncharacterized membrane protein